MRKQQDKVTCRDCAHSRDPHEKDCHGEFFLCRCPFREWSQFLDIPQKCNEFKKR